MFGAAGLHVVHNCILDTPFLSIRSGDFGCIATAFLADNNTLLLAFQPLE